MPSKKKNFYAVKNGRRKGIYRTWPECQAQTLGFKGAVFRGFPTLQETKDWLGPEVMAEDGFVHFDEETATALENANMREEIDPVSGEKRKVRNYVKGGKKNKLNDGSAASVCSDVQQRNTGKRLGVQVNNDVHRLEVVMHFDGGSRGNTGELAGSGAHLVITETSAPIEASDPQSTIDDVETTNDEETAQTVEKEGDNAGDEKKKKKKVHTIRTTVEMREYLKEDPEAIRTNTNNVAEYIGLIIGMKEILDRLQQFSKTKPSNAAVESRPHVYISMFGDSMLVINQMKGLYRCKSPNIKSYYEKAKALEEELKKLEDEAMTIHIAHMQFEHCYRADNEDADRLANEAMDSRTSWKTVDVQKSVEDVKEDEASDWV